MAVAALSAFLSACGGEDAPSGNTTPSPTPTPAQTATPTSNFRQITSTSITDTRIELKREALSLEDINGDGFKDIILANSGDPGSALRETDSKPVILLGSSAGTFSKANTSSLRPLGWANDFVFLDSDKDGYKEILAIDHNREVPGQSLGTSKIIVFEWDGSKFKDLTDSIIDNSLAFWHNASAGDINGDGLLDFSAVTISSDSKVFLGAGSGVFTLSSVHSQNQIGSAGATVILPQEKSVVFLPFDSWAGQVDSNNLEIVKDGKVVLAQDARTGVLPPEWGYSFALSKDINGDGRTDFVALAEDPGTGATGIRIFVTFMQKPDGSFDIFNSFVNENQMTSPGSRAPSFNWIWSDYKFQMSDLDGDGKVDLFWGSWDNATPSELASSTFFGDGTGRFARSEEKSNALFKGVSWENGGRTFVNDVNGDGLGDLLVITSSFTSNSMQNVTPILFLNQSKK